MPFSAHQRSVVLGMMLAALTGLDAQEPQAPVAYGTPHILGIIRDPAIDESSGIARSIRHPGWFWTHNDSGDKPRLFLLDSTAATRTVLNITGARAVDWEDMASFELDGKPFLLVADAGNNRLDRTVLQLYLVEEPQITPQAPLPSISTAATRCIEFQFEGGPKNCESVAVDTKLGRIILISKEVRECSAYELPLKPPLDAGIQTARRIARIPFSVATGLDISPDGSRAVLASYLDGCEFTRRPDETWADAFKRTPRPIPLSLRSQGESICYGADGMTFYLTSEGRNQPLWEIPVKSTKPARPSH